VRATIFGCVLNNVAARDASQGYGGYYYYQAGYYGQDADGEGEGDGDTREQPTAS
jgi:hypothetical protein